MKRQLTGVVLVYVWATVLAAFIDAEPERIAVFVSPPLRDGFVDTTKGIQDSINDIRTKLAEMREFQIVRDREQADVVLIIVKRGVGSESYGERLTYTQYYNNAILESTPVVANTFWVAAVLEVGEYRKELLGSYTHEVAYSMGAWGRCADQIAQHLKSWTAANAEQLRERRKPKP
jgi:hypothetical protein